MIQRNLCQIFHRTELSSFWECCEHGLQADPVNYWWLLLPDLIFLTVQPVHPHFLGVNVLKLILIYESSAVLNLELLENHPPRQVLKLATANLIQICKRDSLLINSVLMREVRVTSSPEPRIVLLEWGGTGSSDTAPTHSTNLLPLYHSSSQWHQMYWFQYFTCSFKNKYRSV